MSYFAVIIIAFILIPIIINAFLIFKSDVVSGKRKILFVIDFLLATAVAIILLVPFFLVYQPLLIIPAFTGYLIVYNFILFKVFKRYMLKKKLEEIEEDVNESIIDTLIQLHRLDHQAAYKILRSGLDKHPGHPSLVKLLKLFDESIQLKKIQISDVNLDNN